MTDLSAEQLSFHLRRLDFVARVCTEDVKANFPAVQCFASELRSRVEPAGGHGRSQRHIVEAGPILERRGPVTVEEELAGLARGEEGVDELGDVGVREEILQERGVVEAAEVEGLLQLGGEPPVPFVHLLVKLCCRQRSSCGGCSCVTMETTWAEAVFL